MKTYPSVALLLSAVLCAGAFAQQPTPPAASAQQQQSGPPDPADEDEAVRITSNLVQLDFVVTDRRGNQVTDLKAEEVEILEDGRPQKLTHFTYVSTEPPAAAAPSGEGAAAAVGGPGPARAARRENVRRTIAVVVDDLGMSFQSLVPARAALRKFVEQQVRPGDLVAVIRTGGEVGALQQFTGDKRQLLASVERLRWNPCSRRGIYLTAPVRQDAASGLNPGGGIYALGSVTPACAQQSVLQTLEALRFIVAGMRELPGRKSVVLLSDSVPLEEEETASGELSQPSAGRLPQLPSVAGGRGGLSAGAGLPTASGNGDARPGAPSSRREYRDPLRAISELAVRSSVVIYGVDTRGLPALGVSAQDDVTGLRADAVGEILSARGYDMVAGREGSESLAQRTGGFVVKNSNDVALGLGRVMNDLRGYYLAGYRPTAETFNRRFHRVRARVPGRPDLTVRSRSGFYGVREEDERPPRPDAADRFNLALASPFTAGDIDVRLTPVFTNLAPSGSFLRTMLHVEGRGLTFRPEADGWRSVDIVLRGVLFGDNGRVEDEHRRAFTVRLRGATLERVRERGLEYVFNMPVKRPGAYQFRVAVLDRGSERVGSAGQFVEVPDLKKNRLALSGLVVSGAAGATPAPGVAESAEGSPAPADSEATPALRRFRRKMSLDYDYLVFNARADKATARPRLSVRTQLFRDGRPVFDREAPLQLARQLDPARALASGRLLLGDDLAPGEYVLQVTVTDPLADREHRTATQWVDFEIVN
ncbi:MAG TPA: VWA domain-containing protein [Pyrinomonadaceae bacterium]|jgi:VWFA-related protein